MCAVPCLEAAQGTRQAPRGRKAERQRIEAGGWDSRFLGTAALEAIRHPGFWVCWLLPVTHAMSVSTTSNTFRSRFTHLTISFTRPSRSPATSWLSRYDRTSSICQHFVRGRRKQSSRRDMTRRSDNRLPLSINGMNDPLLRNDAICYISRYITSRGEIHLDHTCGRFESAGLHDALSWYLECDSERDGRCVYSFLNGLSNTTSSPK